MASKKTKMCLPSVDIREMQIKNTTNYYKLIRMAKIKNSHNTKCPRGFGKTGGCRMIQTLQKTVCQFLTVNAQSPHDPTIPLRSSQKNLSIEVCS